MPSYLFGEDALAMSEYPHTEMYRGADGSYRYLWSLSNLFDAHFDAIGADTIRGEHVKTQPYAVSDPRAFWMANVSTANNAAGEVVLTITFPQPQRLQKQVQ